MAYGQTTTLDLLEIIKVGIYDNRLPRELINNIDSLYAIMTKQQYSKNIMNKSPLIIPVKYTKENGLIYGENIKFDIMEIWVWGDEDLFTYDVYWIMPSHIKPRKKEMSFDFSTQSWFKKELKHYQGSLKAKKINGLWVIKNLTIRESKNSFDPRNNIRESNER